MNDAAVPWDVFAVAWRCVVRRGMTRGLGRSLAGFDPSQFATPEASEQNLAISEWTQARWLARFASDFEEYTGTKLDISYDLLEPLSPDAQLHYVKREVERANLLPGDMDMKQFRDWVQVDKAYAQAESVYKPDDILPMRVTLFCPDDDSSSEHEQKIKAWSEVGTVDFHHVPGTHSTMMQEPDVRVLAERLMVCLA